MVQINSLLKNVDLETSERRPECWVYNFQAANTTMYITNCFVHLKLLAFLNVINKTGQNKLQIVFIMCEQIQKNDMIMT